MKLPAQHRQPWIKSKATYGRGWRVTDTDRSRPSIARTFNDEGGEVATLILAAPKLYDACDIPPFKVDPEDDQIWMDADDCEIAVTMTVGQLAAIHAALAAATKGGA